MSRNVTLLTLVALAGAPACGLPGESASDDGAAMATDGGTAGAEGDAGSDDASQNTSGEDATDDAAGDADEDTTSDDTSGDTADDTSDSSSDDGGTGFPTEQEPLLEEVTLELNDSCGTAIFTTIDWDSFEPHYGDGPAGPVYDELEARNYCWEIIGAIQFSCFTSDEDTAAIQSLGLTQIHCYWDEELPVDPETAEKAALTRDLTDDGVLTWGMNWWTANLTDQVYEWIASL